MFKLYVRGLALGAESWTAIVLLFVTSCIILKWTIVLMRY